MAAPSRQDILSGKWVPSGIEKNINKGAPSREDILSGKWQPTIPTTTKSYTPVAPKAPTVYGPPKPPEIFGPLVPSKLPTPAKEYELSPMLKASNWLDEKLAAPAEYLGKNILAGIGSVNKGLAQTAEFLFPYTQHIIPGYTAIKSLAPSVADIIDMPGKKMIEHAKDVGTAQVQSAQKTNEQLGKAGEIGGQLIQGVVGAIPNAALAMMTAGTSATPQIATAAPQAVSKATALINTIGTATKELVKNPMFWASAARTVGGTYEEAKAEGASELSARATAIISGLLNAGVEVGGGIETLPSNLKQGGTSAVRAWVNSMIDEGKEEVIQGIVENATRKLMYDKGKQTFSLEDEAAVFNPLRAAKEFGTGAAVGGILGGGQIGINKALTPKATLPAPLQPTLQAPAPQPTLAQTQQIMPDVPQIPATEPFGKNTVGAAERNPSSYEFMQNEYGTIKPGETPARTVDVPSQTAPDNKVRQFTRTMMEAKAIPESMLSDFEQEIVKGTFAYKPMTDKAAVSYAGNTITNKGFNGALTDWEAVANGNKVASKNDIALGETLLNQAANAGDTKLAMKLAAELAAEGTRSGQNVQALRLLKKMTPDGQLYYLQKTIQNLNTDLLNKLKTKAPNVQIDESLAAELLNAKNQQEIDAAVGKITQNIADQIPATWGDKWNAWRYLSMLGNPRTHIRNIVGNGIFVPAVKIKNRIAQGLELFIPQAERTKALTADKSIRSFAEQDFNAVKESVTGGGKYNPADLIRDKQTIFKTKPLEWARKANLGALEAEDAFFLKMHYVDSFASAMKARGLTAEFLGNGTKAANLSLESLRNYATQEAQKATYRDASELATLLNNSKRRLSQSDSLGMKAGGVLLEGVLPFTKTPINILKRGVEYSPAGLVNGLKSAMFDVKSGKASASEAIDKIASGLTGTGIVALGMWLASMGLISGGSKDDKKEQGFERLQGEQNYALTFDGKSYTLDWAAPASLPLFVGVEIYNTMQGENPDKSISALLNSMTKLTEPMVEMSLLQGLNNTFKAIAYGEAPLSDMMTELAAGYASQGVPTLFGQVARTMDPLRRSTYIDKNSPLPEFAQKFVQKQQAKIPVASQEIMPYIDQWGRTQENLSLAGRLSQNFLSPGYYSESRTTPVDAELNRLYSQTGEKTILPGYAEKTITVDGEKINLTAKQYQTYATAKGNLAYDTLSNLIKSPQYKSMPEDEQIKTIRDVYDYANSVAKTKVSNYQLEGTSLKISEAQKNGIEPYEYIMHRAEYTSINKKYEDYTAAEGEPSKNVMAATEFSKYLDSQKLTPTQDEFLRGNLKFWNMTPAKPEQYSESTLNETNAKLWKNPDVQNAVGSVENLVKAKNIISEIKGDKDESAKQKEISEISKQLGISMERATGIYNELVTFKHDISEMSSKHQALWPDFKSKNMSEKDYLKYINRLSLVTGDEDEYDNTISGTLKPNRVQEAKNMGLNDSQANYLVNQLYYFKHDVSKLSSKQQETWQTFKAAGTSEKIFLDYVNQDSLLSKKKDKYKKMLELGLSPNDAKYFLMQMHGYANKDWT